MRKLMLREVKNLSVSHRRYQWWNQDFNSAYHDPVIYTRDLSPSHTQQHCSNNFPLFCIVSFLSFLDLTGHNLFLLLTYIYTHTPSFGPATPPASAVFCDLFTAKLLEKSYQYSLPAISHIPFSWTHTSQESYQLHWNNSCWAEDAAQW
jgi:alpha-glucosidase (family GH31 glycosyl hydrolase)